MGKNQVNIKYTTNILHFQVEVRKQNPGHGENPVYRITKKYVPLNR